ncbi:NAD(P)-dependent dehydrogenase (short-subunit alcohol dehydrogenase family) [Microterricola gilva]|uniref:NAD(P)-dependent dehydrogenase (Short-subunit alcohol dehydrogenase family) n=1 Tax=Microterricola gilva TaxID=393267 RepID=A0A4Q8ANU7_9MICO|nr:SDR family oxidoreductase [Microterricola gilva]RZU66228.1 NAD(P)-dependent dehydrogenase (short-subunit alcohol dehydrogenase family) [Microterricola gilva]
MSTRFDGRVAAVTGSTSGIGRGIAVALAAEGARVFGLDLPGEIGPGAIGSSEIEAGIERIPCDVSDAESVARAAATLLEATGGRIDHVVANAGIRGADTPAEQLPVTEFDAVIAVNLRGVFLTLQAFAPAMLAGAGGSMVAVASMSGNRVVNVPQHTVAYNTAKAGVTALVRTLAVEWGGRGVRVNTVSPGYVSTPFLEADAAMHPLWLPQTVPGRFARIDEIAAGTLYLLSDAAGYCHGSDLLIDGGYSLR